MTKDANVDHSQDVERLAEEMLGRADADQAQLLGPDGLLTQRVLNRALEAEHLGYEKGDPAGRGSGNNRNGATTKRVGWFPNTPVRSRLSALPLSGCGLCGAVRVRLLEQNLSLLQR